MKILSLIVLTFAALLGIVFALLNGETVSVNYFLGTQKLPLSILIISILILGIFIGWLLTWPRILKLKLQLRKHIKARPSAGH